MFQGQHESERFAVAHDADHCTVGRSARVGPLSQDITHQEIGLSVTLPNQVVTRQVVTRQVVTIVVQASNIVVQTPKTWHSTLPSASSEIRKSELALGSVECQV